MAWPAALIAQREFRTYVATASFWFALAMPPLIAAAVLMLPAGTKRSVPILVVTNDPELSRSAAAALGDVARLEGRRFSIGKEGERVTLRLSGYTVEMSFSASFPLSRQGRATVGYEIERDLARRNSQEPPVVVRENQANETGEQAAKISRLVAMGLLWLTLTGSLGMLLQAVVRERANRALESLLAAARPWEIVAGKMLGVGAVSILVLFAWLGSAAGLSLFLPQQQGVVFAALSDLVRLSNLLRDGLIYVAAFTFYGGAIMTLGALARDNASAQNLVRPLFLILVVAFFCAFMVRDQPVLLSRLVWVPPLTPFLLLIVSTKTVALKTQAALLGILFAAAAGVVGLAAKSLSVTSRPFYRFKKRLDSA